MGDFLAAVSNKYAGVFFAGPGAVRMENLLVRWIADLVGYPAGAAGDIASGGSIATLAAVCAARDAHGIAGAEVARAVVYLTSQAHHCMEKSLRIAGLGEAVLRFVAMDERHRMRPDALAAAIAADRAAGLRPWLVLAAAGTVDTGAVDPLDAIGASPNGSAAGSTSTRPTAASSCSPRTAGGRSGGSSARTRWCSTRTRDCSCPMAPGSWSAATRRRCWPPTSIRARTCRTPCATPASSRPPTCRPS